MSQSWTRGIWEHAPILHKNTICHKKKQISSVHPVNRAEVEMNRVVTSCRQTVLARIYLDLLVGRGVMDREQYH